MKPAIDKVLQRLLTTYERRVLGKKPVPFGWAARLSAFEHTATEREWQQLMYYSELVGKLRGVPGDVAEFGVAGGVSFLAFARCLRVQERGFDKKERRKLYGFDSFEGLPPLSELDKAPTVTDGQMKEGGFHVPEWYEPLFRFVEQDPSCALIKGWFDQSLPRFLADNPHASFALVHVDCDLYESTRVVLEQTWDRVVPGGLVVFDELFHKDYPGETLAFREFFAARKAEFTMHRSDVKPDKKYLVKVGAAPTATRAAAAE
jgi:hypothetical protein